MKSFAVTIVREGGVVSYARGQGTVLAIVPPDMRPLDAELVLAEGRYSTTAIARKIGNPEWGYLVGPEAADAPGRRKRRLDYVAASEILSLQTHAGTETADLLYIACEKTSSSARRPVHRATPNGRIVCQPAISVSTVGPRGTWALSTAEGYRSRPCRRCIALTARGSISIGPDPTGYAVFTNEFFVSKRTKLHRTLTYQGAFILACDSDAVDGEGLAHAHDVGTIPRCRTCERNLAAHVREHDNVAAYAAALGVSDADAWTITNRQRGASGYRALPQVFPIEEAP